MNPLAHVFVIVIARTPEDVWQALTGPEFTRQYWHQSRVDSDFREGSPIRFLYDDDRVGCEGCILTSRPPVELAYTWHFPLNAAARDEAPSRVTFRLDGIATGTKLTVTHDRFPDQSQVAAMVGSGWPFVLGGLKTLLETGHAVDFTVDG